MRDGSSSRYGERVALIRHAERGDLDEILRLDRLARDGMASLGPLVPAGFRDSGQLRSSLQSMLRAEPRSVFVAEDGRGAGLAGYAMATVAENEAFSVRRYGYLVCLYVGQESRDRGRGVALLEAVEGRFRGDRLQAAQVEVLGRDAAAQSFWCNRGFQRFLDHLWRPADSAICAGENSGFVVRQAGLSDREAVVGLWKEMMDIHEALDQRLSIAPDWRDQVEQSVRRWLRDRNSRLLVAEGVGGVIGFALGGVARTTLGIGPAEYGHIAHLCVTSEFRRRGVGRRLFDSMREWFVRRGVASIHLYVSCLNPASQQFWREMGFEDYVARLWCDLL
jgi:ribosomal protein S18 acetylase RimI-like enzyme